MFTKHTAVVNGVKQHFITGGNGEPVVLLHGFLKTSHAWRKVMPLLAERYSVVAPDLRGVGDSAKPLNGYDGHTVGEDIYELMRHLGHEQFFLVGHDVGGWVAYAVTVNHPKAIKGLAIIDVALPGIGLENTMDVAAGGSWHFGFLMNPDLPEALVTGKERVFIEWFQHNNIFVPGSVTPADTDEYVRCYSQAGALRSAFNYYRALPEDARQNWESAKQKLAMPVLAVGAANAGNDLTIKDLQAVASDVRGVIIADCGHYVPEEQPEELARHLLAFFGERQP